MNKQIILVTLMLLFCVTYVSAETETYPYNQSIDLKFTCTLNNAIPSPTTEYNITVSYPNGTTFINNKPTTAQGSGSFNYTTNFPVIGLYKVQSFCYDNTYSYSSVGYYEVTGNGKTAPGSGIVVMFSIFFIILLSGITYVIIYSIGHAVTLDFDILDAAYNYGLFFALVGLRYLEFAYLGNPTIQNILDWSIEIGIWTNLVLPTLYFILTLTISPWVQNKKQGVGVYK